MTEQPVPDVPDAEKWDGTAEKCWWVNEDGSLVYQIPSRRTWIGGTDDGYWSEQCYLTLLLPPELFTIVPIVVIPPELNEGGQSQAAAAQKGMTDRADR